VTSAPALLGVAGLSIRFGGLDALSGVDLTVRVGEIFALIGPNGAGKTTVFNVVTGLYRPLAGRVRFDGHDVLTRAPHMVARLGIARTFQNTEVFRGLSALDNVRIGAHARLRGSVLAAALGMPSVRREESKAREQAHRLLARVMSPIMTPRASPSGSRSAWSWPGRSPWNRDSSCSMSRRAGSIPPRRRG